MNPDAALTYLDFVADRHKVWQRRQRGDDQPWSDDPILASKKFTNVYRVLDPGSQFVLTDLLAEDLTPRDALFRCFLYRFTNRPETWRYLRRQLGHYPTADDLGDDLVSLIKTWRGYGETVFSGAYMIVPQPGVKGDKVDHLVELCRWLFDPASKTFVMPRWEEAETQQERLQVLTDYRGVGDFMAMQILTDWGYGPLSIRDLENEFIRLGPGAINGAKAIAPKANPMKTFEWALEAVHSIDEVPLLVTPQGRARRPSYMDVQNTLCEFSKYVRYQRAVSPGQPYRPAHPGPQAPPVLPQHW